jgi:hypothetical protein
MVAAGEGTGVANGIVVGSGVGRVTVTGVLSGWQPIKINRNIRPAKRGQRKYIIVFFIFFIYKGPFMVPDAPPIHDLAFSDCSSLRPMTAEKPLISKGVSYTRPPILAKQPISRSHKLRRPGLNGALIDRVDILNIEK